MPTKYCFMNKDRPCDLTCKAAFPVDDPVDPVDCYFIWLASHFGESMFDLRGVLEHTLPGFSSAPREGDPPPGSKPANN